MRSAISSWLDGTRARGPVGSTLARRERLLVGGEAAAGVVRVHDREARARLALRDHVLDPRPARRGRPDLDLAAEAGRREALAQAGEPRLDDVDAGERRAVERRVALGDERREAVRDLRVDRRELASRAATSSSTSASVSLGTPSIM